MKHFVTDAGRSTSSHKNETRDCTVRALATAAALSYDEARALMKRMGRKDRRGPQGYNGIMTKYSGKRSCKRSGSLGKFVDSNPTGRFIIHVRGHALALIDGVIHDIRENNPRKRVIAAWRLK